MLKNLGAEGKTQGASKAVGGNQRHRKQELLRRNNEPTQDSEDEKNAVTSQETSQFAPVQDLPWHISTKKQQAIPQKALTKVFQPSLCPELWSGET